MQIMWGAAEGGLHTVWSQPKSMCTVFGVFRRIRKNPATPEPGAVTAGALASSVQCSLHLQPVHAKGPGISAATADAGEEQCTGWTLP